jgi:hypothetical protein
MVLLEFNATPVISFEALVRAVPEASFKSPARSTVPLLDFWRNPADRLEQFGPAVHSTPLLSATLSFEYPVAVRRGRGKASYTDLMITSESTAIAVEAKFTEPRYENVRDWLGTTSSENRRDVLAGWLDCISGIAAKPVEVAEVSNIPYQLIHRTASVCSLVRRERIVVYQLFGASDLDVYRRDLTALHTLVSTAAIRFVIVACPFKKSVRYVELEAAWHRGERHDLSGRVRQALLDGPLFTFAVPLVSDAA